MNDMTIPEKVGDMLKPMHPIPRKIQRDKGNEINNDGRLNTCQRKMFQKKGVRQNDEWKTENVFGDIRYTAAQAADHIHIAHCIFPFVPTKPFFK